MKHIIYGLTCMLLVIFIVTIILTVQGRTLRSTEAEHALAESVDSALSNVMEEMYPIENAELFAADLLQALLVQTNSTSDLTVSILEADLAHGILSVEITESYSHPNGNKGTVSACRTVIFDKEVEEEPESHTVSFYTADKELYKAYTIPKDSYCSMPAAPKKEGKIFKNWRFVTGGAGVAGQAETTVESTGASKNVVASGGVPFAVTEDISLIAVFE